MTLAAMLFVEDMNFRIFVDDVFFVRELISEDKIGYINYKAYLYERINRNSYSATKSTELVIRNKFFRRYFIL